MAFDFGNANEAQRSAISTTDGPLLIIAGPGTGKTYTLVKRIVYLIIEKDVLPEEIMIATFTEKAAKELITRITNELYAMQFMYERLILIRDLLCETGSLYLHCDYHRSHYLRCILDEVFGSNNFINEIIWKRRGGALNNSKSFGQLTDTIG